MQVKVETRFYFLFYFSIQNTNLLEIKIYFNKMFSEIPRRGVSGFKSKPLRSYTRIEQAFREDTHKKRIFLAVEPLRRSNHTDKNH